MFHGVKRRSKTKAVSVSRKCSVSQSSLYSGDTEVYSYHDQRNKQSLLGLPEAGQLNDVSDSVKSFERNW